MISTILTTLQSALSKVFASSLLPVFLFTLFNGVILGHFSRPVHDWIADFMGADTLSKGGWTGVTALIVFVAAYIYSSFTVVLRQTLEGRYLPGPIRTALATGEKKRLEELEREYTTSRRRRRELLAKGNQWKDQLRTEREAGRQTRQFSYTTASQAGMNIKELQSRRWKGDLIEPKDLQTAVTMFAGELRSNSTDITGVAAPTAEHQKAAIELDEAHQDLVKLIDYAGQRAESEYIDLFITKDSNFSRYTLAPTQMGNIAASVQSYAYSRYALNLESFWSRLQDAMGDNQPLQAAQTQLDFMIALFWLTVASTVIWLVLVPLLSNSWLQLLAVWALGPALARAWYLVALENYRAVAELMRSAVDMNRFKLLGDLHMATPPDSDSERKLWILLNRKTTYGDSAYVPYSKANS
jgi:hypothetical protein